MNFKKGFCQFIAKCLVLLMILQGIPLWQLSRAYTFEFQPEKINQLIDLISFLSPAAAEAATTDADAETVLFESTYTRENRAPFTEIVTFSNISGPVIIKLFNGGTDGDLSKKVSSVLISLNGETVFDDSDIGQNIDILEKNRIAKYPPFVGDYR